MEQKKKKPERKTYVTKALQCSKQSLKSSAVWRVRRVASK